MSKKTEKFNLGYSISKEMYKDDKILEMSKELRRSFRNMVEEKAYFMADYINHYDYNIFYDEDEEDFIS
jgi:hypothetical protein